MGGYGGCEGRSFWEASSRNGNALAGLITGFTSPGSVFRGCRIFDSRVETTSQRREAKANDAFRGASVPRVVTGKPRVNKPGI